MSANLVQDFGDFFNNMIETIMYDITSKFKSNVNNVTLGSNFFIVCRLDATISEIKKVKENSPNKSCELDPMPTWLLKSCLREPLSILTKIVNTSLETAHVPAAFKSAHVSFLVFF